MQYAEISQHSKIDMIHISGQKFVTKERNLITVCLEKGEKILFIQIWLFFGDS